MPLSGGNYSTARAAQRKGAFDARFLAPGTNAFIGKIQVDLAGLEAPQALKLVATVASGQSGRQRLEPQL
jgi:hypothetical protein